ncbi:toxin glutamine deamidase domain-containing protein [Kitasatospora camelliae]|uniref:Toxin glutamine deamidase domain-containing protein n=1 Tax=Kitasatospora camelliae TaxID=3156397 RepID=A0AAU8JWN5_9ACTN
MSRKLPEELAPVLARLGQRWPEADEDGLRRAAGLWREFGAEAERLSRRGGDSAQRVTGENSGRAVEAFGEHWRNFSGGGRGHLDDAHGAAEAMAHAFDKAAAAADHCKAELVSVLTELAAEIEKDDAAEAAAKTQVDTAGCGVGGLVDKVAGTVKGAVAEVAEAAAVEVAKLKVIGLLHELGREMRDAVQAAVKEPAVTALERIAQADGRGLHGEYRTMSAARASGQLEGALGAGAIAGSAAVSGVTALSAKVGPDGKVVTDRHGNPVLVAPDGTTVSGVKGLSLAVGEDGKPEIGPDGKPVLVDAAGREVTGLAVGADGKPMVGADGKPLLVSAEGDLGDTGLKLTLGPDGQPLLGGDGRPAVVGEDGLPVVAMAIGTNGRLLADKEGHVVGLDGDGHRLDGLPGGLPGTAVGPDGPDGGPDRTKTGPGGPLGPGDGHGLGKDGKPVLGVDTQVGPHGVDLDLRTAAGDLGTGLQPDAESGVHAGAGFGGNGDQGPRPFGGDHGARGNGGGSSGGWGSSGFQTQAAVDVSGGFDPDPSPAPSHHVRGPISVHTDSVAMAPPAPSPVLGGGDGPSGGGWRPEPAGPVGPGGSAGSGGGFQLGPVGGGSAGVPAGGAAGVPAGGTVGGAPGAVPPVGAGAGVPAPGPAAPGGAAGPAAGAVPGQPGAAPAAGSVVGAPLAGQPGQGGQGGSAAAVVVGPHPGSGARTPAAPAPGGGGIGQQPANPGPVRMEPYAEYRRRPEGFDTPTAGGNGLPVHPGQASAAWLVVQTSRRTGDGAPGAPRRPGTLADSRPYGQPGGLGPVDPAHQAESVRRAPLGLDGVPAVHPDPRAGAWTEAVNGGGYREPGRANNCVDLALSTVEGYASNPTCGAPRLPDGPAGERGGRDRAESELGTRFLDLGDGPAALERLARSLLFTGHGAQAVLLTLDEFGRSHTWNAVNHEGVLGYLDPQTGRQSDTPLYRAEQGLWAIALDAERRPVDLTEAPSTVAVPSTPAPAPAPRTATAPPAPEPAPAAPAPAEPAGEPAKPEPARAAATEPEPAAEPAPAAPEPAAPRSRLTVHRTAARPRSTR